MKTKILLVTILIVCGNIFHLQAQNNVDSVNTLLTGKWNFTACYGGFSGDCPENPGPGNQRSVVFEKTSTDSILFFVYRNDTLIFSGQTMLTYQSTTFSDHWLIDKDVVHGTELSDPLNYYVINLTDSNALEFMEPCIDCYYYQYEKENVPVGINTLNDSKELIAFPNPNKGILYLKANHDITKIEILDVSGKVLFSRTFTPITSNVLIDLTDIKNGVYFIRSISGEAMKIEKFIKL